MLLVTINKFNVSWEVVIKFGGLTIVLSDILAEKAFGDDGNLKQPKQLPINKVGHGMRLTLALPLKVILCS